MRGPFRFSPVADGLERVREAIPAVRVTTVAQSGVARYVRSAMAAQGSAWAGSARPRDRRRRL